MFHDSKKEAALIVAGMPGAGPKDDGAPMEGDHNEDLHGLAEEFLAAVHSKDAGAVAEAFRAMFLAMEAEPHDEFDDGEEGDTGAAG